MSGFKVVLLCDDTSALSHLIYQAGEADGVAVEHVEAVADPIKPKKRNKRPLDKVSNPATNNRYTEDELDLIYTTREADLPQLADQLGRSVAALQTQRRQMRRAAEHVGSD